jgi:hypothetical protein
MSNKLTRKLQVLITDEEVQALNIIILNDALEAEQRPISVSAFIRELIRREIDRRPDLNKEWDKTKVKHLKSK